MVAKKGVEFQRPWFHSGRIRGGITQLPGDATAVIGCSTWVKRALILPLLYTFNIHFLTWFDVINAQFSKHPIVCSLKIFDNQTVVFDRFL